MNINFKLFFLNLIIDLLLIQTSDERSILVRDEDLPTINDRITNETPKKMRNRINIDVEHLGNVYVRLAIFYDKHLLMKFSGNQTDLKRFVSSIVYTSQLFFNRENIRNFAYFKLKVVSFQEYPGQNITGPEGNNDHLLSHFCKYSKQFMKTGKEWDRAAILFTGLNIWSYLEGSKDTNKLNNRMDSDLGMSFQDTICSQYSCAIIEAREFMSCNTFTHELGHIFNIRHDGEGKIGCLPFKFIMTARYSNTRINEWSNCSVQQLKDKLQEIYNNSNKTQNCLKENVEVFPEFDFPKQNLPGVVWTADKQCQFGLGPNYRAITVVNNKRQDICRTLVCRSNWYERQRGFPALESTYCGSKWKNNQEMKHYCRSENCVYKWTEKERGID